MSGFEYAGLHFIPLPQKLEGDFFTTTRRSRSVGIGNYPWSSIPYDYDDFYKSAAAVGGGESDLFLCVEDGCAYVPFSNELMRYLNADGSAYRPSR